MVIVGANAAGMGAASKLRRLDSKREIIVFEKGRHASYAACGLPYVIEGKIDEAEQLIVRSPEVFREKQRIGLHLGHEVTAIDARGKRVRVNEPGNGTGFWQSYTDLLIATGASPYIPDMEGSRAPGVFALASLQSGKDIEEYIDRHSPGTAVVAGGGYIGLEMAEALIGRNIGVSLIDMAPQLMTTMDEEMAGIIADYMTGEGVKLYFGEKLKGIAANDHGRVRGIATPKRSIGAELLILGLGMRPNSKLAKEAGIELGAGGAIRVNNLLQTSVPHIWAAGDCTETVHLLSGEKVYMPLGTTAAKHGMVAGININGGSEAFAGVLGTAITKFRSLEVARTGFSERQAKERRIECKTSVVDSFTSAAYYPGSGKITVKLVAEKDSGRLLGGQIVGMPGSGKRIDAVVAAIHSGMTARDLVFLDLSYAPPFSQVWDPVQIAARQLI